MIERDRIDALSQLLGDLEQDLERSDKATGRHRPGAALWVRLLIGLVAAFALSNLYFVNNLTDEVRLVITRMQEMATLFARVSERMDQMSDEVAAIDRQVLLMPVVAEQMREMSSHVLVMEQAVSQMDGATTHLSGTVASMNTSMHDMSIRFRALNQSVGAMGVDVDQMARPVP
jgi:methyl-accepting chemotaxis protein